MTRADFRRRHSLIDPRRLIVAAGGVMVLAYAVLAVSVPIASPGQTSSVAFSEQFQSADGVDAVVNAVASVGITVSDLEKSIGFYRDVLGFRVIAKKEQAGDEVERLSGLFGVRTLSARLRLGSEEIVLTQYLAPEGRPIPADSRSNDRWFQHIAIVVSDMPRAYEHLRKHRVRHASSGPQTLPLSNPNAGGISAFYFKDPDGHVLEVIQFPQGKGDPRWQLPTSELFLGIDHTAIVVADTEQSLAFYRDALGMKVAGGAENFGTEQEHLNNVFGARLRITALRAATGPGVELLEYLAPGDGREYPPDSKASDLWQWHATVTLRDAEHATQLLRRLPKGATSWVSSGIVDLSGGSRQTRRAFQVRDPDGHVVEFIEEDAPGALDKAGK